MVRVRNLKFDLILIYSCLLSFALLSATCSDADAAFDCISCHRMPPMDSSFRDWQTGGFKGNHQTHLPVNASKPDCSVCHPAEGYTSGHMNSMIEFQANIKNSPATGVYKVNGQIVLFKNQTTVPNTGKCSNVNCHFENETPQWGTESFTYNPPLANDCNKCHGTPPSGIGQNPVGGTAGSHARHDQYYTGIEQCRKCHPNHLTDSNRFSHATSAGNRNLAIHPRSPQDIPGGNYSGQINDYLPSQNNTFGSCTNLYCHSPGIRSTEPFFSPNQTATWGGTLDCAGCHNSPPATGSHYQHLATTYAVPVPCYKCHASTVTSGMEISSKANHANGYVTIAFNSSSTAINGRYSSHPTPVQKRPGSGYAECENVYCHSSGQNTGGTWPPAYSKPKWGTSSSGKCNTCHDHGYHSSGNKLSSGSHDKHLKNGLTTSGATMCGACHYGSGFAEPRCTQCHEGSNVLTNLHVNGSIDVGFVTKFGGTYSGTPRPGDGYGSCSNTYCHSSGNGLAPLVAAQWGEKLDCRGCHGGDASHANVITTGKHRNHLDPGFNASLGTGTGIMCAACHVKTVGFSNNTSITNQGNHVNTLKDYSGARAGKITAAGQCANVYCHSSGQSTPVFRTMTGSKLWTGNATLGCKGCHGYAPGAFDPIAGEPNYTSGGINTGTANNHLTHVGNAGIIDSRGCAKCHAKTVDPTAVNKLKNYSAHHVDGNRDVDFSVTVGGSYSAAGKSCNNTKCHGSGNPQWGGITLACNACHGASFTSFSSTSKKGAHAAHYQTDAFSTYAQAPANNGTTTLYRFTCSSCHSGPAAHANLSNNASNYGVAEVFFGFTSAGKKPSYNYGASTTGIDSGTFTWTAGGSSSCNLTYCHSNGAGGNGAPIQWNSAKGTLACTGCHGNSTSNTLSGKHAVHLNPASNPSLGTGNGLSCVDCHAKTVSSNTAIKDKSKHVNKFKEFSSLHGGGSSRYSTGTKLCTNIYCHSNGNQGPLVYVTPPAWNSASTLACNGCHGTGSTIGAPDYANGGAGNATANSHSAHISGYADTTVCADCHAKTADMAVANKLKNYTAASYHINGTADLTFKKATAGANVTWNKSTGQCSNIACHGNGSATWGSNAGCLACHENPIGNRAGIGSQFNGNSHHVQGVAANGTHCYQCHWEANSNGTINRSYHQRTANAPVDLVIYGNGTRPTTYTVGATVVQYTANNTRAELAKINTHCLACHSTANDSATPFNDGKTPKAYAWDGTSINARYGDTTTTAWGKYAGGNVTPKNRVTKAFSAHGNATANQGGWDLNETWPNKRTGTANIFCFDCHNSHGSTVSGTTTSYASATLNGGILKDTSAGKGGYSMSYKPAQGGLSVNHNAYNAGAGLCFDCHLSASPGTTPWGYSATFGATQAILGYMDTPYFGLGSFGTQQRFPYKATANMGGHLGVSSTLLVSATRPINGLCTPCHDPHGISTTMGSNRQYAVPLLKGTWVTSPYKEDVATRDNSNYPYLASRAGEDGPKPTPQVFAAYTAAIKSYKIDQNTFTSGSMTHTDTQFGGLCLSCHPKTSLTNGTTHTWKSKDRIHESVKGWKTANTTIQHNYTCSKCHAPHNARLPRLMVSNCLDYKHRGRVTNNLNPVTSGTYRKDGWGEGALPGSYAGGENGPTGTPGSGKWSGWGSQPPTSNLFTCHENNDSTQKWNTKTPWTK